MYKKIENKLILTFLTLLILSACHFDKKQNTESTVGPKEELMLWELYTAAELFGTTKEGPLVKLNHALKKHPQYMPKQENVDSVADSSSIEPIFRLKIKMKY